MIYRDMKFLLSPNPSVNHVLHHNYAVCFTTLFKVTLSSLTLYYEATLGESKE